MTPQRRVDNRYDLVVSCLPKQERERVLLDLRSSPNANSGFMFQVIVSDDRTLHFIATEQVTLRAVIRKVREVEWPSNDSGTEQMLLDILLRSDLDGEMIGNHDSTLAEVCLPVSFRYLRLTAGSSSVLITAFRSKLDGLFTDIRNTYVLCRARSIMSTCFQL